MEKPSRCILFFKMETWQFRVLSSEKESNRKGGETLLDAIKAYAYSTVCRQNFYVTTSEELNPAGYAIFAALKLRTQSILT